MNRRQFSALVSALSLSIPLRLKAEEQVKSSPKRLPVKGELFEVDSRESFLIESESAGKRNAKPWVWYAPTLKPYPGPEERWMIERFLEAGISVAGIDVGESYGSPSGVALYDKFFDELTRNRNFSSKPALLARSRGGLMLYNWAILHPTNVGCIAGIYPVCDYKSWPGAENAAPAYGLEPETLVAESAKHNPVERLAPLAKAGVPIFHIHGDSDTVVPLDRNSGAVAERYEKLGGKMTLVVPKGQGHNMWRGFFECQELVDFVIRHLTSPK